MGNVSIGFADSNVAVVNAASKRAACSAMFASFLFILSVLLFINYRLSNDIVSLAVTAVVCIWILLSRQREALYISLFFAPFSYLFRYSQWNLYIFVQLSLVLKCIMLKRVKAEVFFFSVVYFLLYILSSLEATIKFGSFIPLVSLVSLLFAASLYEKKERTNCMLFFISGFLVSSFFGLFARETRLVWILDSNPIMLGTGSVMQRFGGLLPDCNFYTILSVLCISFVAFSYGIRQTAFIRLLVFFALVVFGALTFSKSFYICLVIVLLFMVFAFWKKQSKFLLPVVFLGVVAYLLFRDKIDLVLNTSIGRFLNSAGDLNSFTNGRYNYWILYLEEWGKSGRSFLLGYGSDSLLDGHIVAHNTFIEVLYKFGLIGLTTNLILVVFAARTMGIKINANAYNFLPVFLLLIATFNLSAYSFYPLWGCIFVSLMVLDYNPKEEKVSRK